MNDSEKKTAESQLRELRGGLLARSTEKPIVERLPDPVDNALGAANTARIAAERDHDTKMLHQIDGALEALRDGDYGICAGCDEEIPAKRLAAVPWATRCVACAQAEENRRKSTVEY